MFQKPKPIFFQSTTEDPPPYSRGLRAAGLGLGLGALYQAHDYSLRNSPNLANNLFRWAETFEERSPARLGRIFGFAERRSAYVVDDVKLTYKDLVTADGQLTDLGQHLQRLIGDQLGPGGVKGMTEGLSFRRGADAADPYLYLSGREHIRVRWERVGRRTGASFRLDRDLFEKNVRFNFRGEWWRPSRLRENWDKWKSAQYPRAYEGVRADFAGGTYRVAPQSAMYGVDSFGRAKDYYRRARVTAFELFERPQKLMADFGIGLKGGSYNKIFHVPFFGEGGMINEMLTKRVLPITLAFTLAGYLDYKTGHHVSNFAVSLPLRANVLRADLTDDIPGARRVTDFYQQTVPGAQYGPLALPLAGATAGALLHYSRVLRGVYDNHPLARKAMTRIFAKEGKASFLKYFADTPVGVGTAIGVLAALPFIPGMLGSRKTGRELRDIYSGRESVPVRAGRWWDLGSSSFEGGRIKTFRPHWYQLFRNRAEKVSVYGSEQAYWQHNPLLHPFRYLRDPYWLEKQNYFDRPYPISSPAFSNVPLVGPLLAATIGKVIKPPIRMHPEWSGHDYTLYSTRLEPRRGLGIHEPEPEAEYGLMSTIKTELHQMSDWLGAFGFLGRTFKDALFPRYDRGKEVFFQGSRQMTSWSRRYYEHELGAGYGPEQGEEGVRGIGYSEAFRRFVQREESEPQANEIPNRMPSWLPGDDYFINFREGDPYVKIDMGYARLPGRGYEALHPELKGLKPDDYPDLVKLSILGDVAPYSREYAGMRSRVGAQAKRSTEIQIEYQKILDRVQQLKHSTVRSDERRFTAGTDTIEGTVKAATPSGIELEEYPGRVFSLSGVGTSAADLSAVALSEHNNLNKSQVARDVEQRQARIASFFRDNLASGTHVTLTIPQGAAEYGERVRAVVETHETNINRALLGDGLGRYRKDQSGAEAKALHGFLGQTIGKLAESVAFTGDNGALNPLRFIPTPGHTKLWQERTALAQYENEEYVGTRMRRWQRPLHDFIAPYLRGTVKRLTGQRVIGEDTQYGRDLNTLTDTLNYLRAIHNRAQGGPGAGRYTSQARRTSAGANLLAEPTFLASTLPPREAEYFRRFINETDPDKRKQILKVVSPEMGRALSAQWAAQRARIEQAEGHKVAPVGEGGRIYTEEGMADYRRAKTKLGYGDYMRSQEIAEFFKRTGFRMPDKDSNIWSDVIDYEDVKLKIVQQEGYDMHDFGIFEDRANLLWRKPWLDGTARELTSGDKRSVDNLRQQVEQLMLASKQRNPDVRTVATKSHRAHGKIRLDVDVNDQAAVDRDMRRNPEHYS